MKNQFGGPYEKDSSYLLSYRTYPFFITSRLADDDALRNVGEKSADRQALRQDRRALADDLADLNRLSDLAMRLDALRDARASEAEIREVQNQIAVELRRDIAETKVQTAQVQREINQSRHEIRSDRQELREDHADLKKPRPRATARKSPMPNRNCEMIGVTDG